MIPGESSIHIKVSTSSRSSKKQRVACTFDAKRISLFRQGYGGRASERGNPHTHTHVHLKSLIIPRSAPRAARRSRRGCLASVRPGPHQCAAPSAATPADCRTSGRAPCGANRHGYRLQGDGRPCTCSPSLRGAPHGAWWAGATFLSWKGS
jgi:hypothetical protein